jgi:hypothetical protein
VRPLVRVHRVGPHPIDALTVADVDNDGDLDIHASARDGQLVLWRNAGNGQFRLATAPAAPPRQRAGRAHRPLPPR